MCHAVEYVSCSVFCLGKVRGTTEHSQISRRSIYRMDLINGILHSLSSVLPSTHPDGLLPFGYLDISDLSNTMSFPCRACEKEGRTCHIDVRCEGCFECAHRNLDCYLGSRPDETNELKEAFKKLQEQTHQAAQERRRLYALAPKPPIQRWNEMRSLQTKEERVLYGDSDVTQPGPSRDRQIAKLREMLAMDEFQIIKPFLTSDNAYRYLRDQTYLARGRYGDAWAVELEFLDELKVVEDDMEEILGVKGLEEFRESELSDLYWDPSKKRLVSMNEDAMEVDMERLTLLQ